jgi:hypothetical protein
MITSILTLVAVVAAFVILDTLLNLKTKGGR